MANLHIDSAVKVGNTKYNLYDLVTSIEDLNSNVQTLNNNIRILNHELNTIGNYADIRYNRQTLSVTAWDNQKLKNAVLREKYGIFGFDSTNSEIVIQEDGLYLCYGELTCSGSDLKDLVLTIQSKNGGNLAQAYGTHTYYWTSLSTLGCVYLSEGDRVYLVIANGYTESFEILENTKLLLVKL